MKKKITLTILLFIFACPVFFCQTYIALARKLINKEWIYLDQNGNKITDQAFRNCGPFSEDGFAVIYNSLKNDYYFIDIHGDVLPVEIEGFRLKLSGFSDGFALYCSNSNDKWGYLSTSGKVVCDAKYNTAWDFTDGYALGKIAGKFCIIDSLFNEYIIEDKNIKDVNNISEGRFSFRTANRQVGILDEKGEIIVEAQFLTTGEFHNGIAWVKTQGNKIGYINREGEWIIEPKFHSGKNFDSESGLAKITYDKRTGFVNKAGEIKYYDTHDGLGNFSNGLCWCRKGELIGFLNAELEWAISPKFLSVQAFKNGYAAARTVEKNWGVIDKTGNWVIEPVYSATKDMVKVVSE